MARILATLRIRDAPWPGIDVILCCSLAAVAYMLKAWEELKAGHGSIVVSRGQYEVRGGQLRLHPTDTAGLGDMNLTIHQVYFWPPPACPVDTLVLECVDSETGACDDLRLGQTYDLAL